MAYAEWLRFAGWAAYLSAAASIATFVTATIFFAKGQPWGTINDAVSVVQMLLMLPLVPALHRILAPHSPSFSLLAALIGAAGMWVAGVLQTLLVLGRIKYERQIGGVMAAGIAIGLWLMIGAYLVLSSRVLPSTVAWWGLVAGTGYLVIALGYFLGGQESKVVMIGAIPVLLGYTLWAIGLGRFLTSLVPG